jgi:hypothetical protein
MTLLKNRKEDTVYFRLNNVKKIIRAISTPILIIKIITALVLVLLIKTLKVLLHSLENLLCRGI